MSPLFRLAQIATADVYECLAAGTPDEYCLYLNNWRDDVAEGDPDCLYFQPYRYDYTISIAHRFLRLPCDACGWIQPNLTQHTPLAHLMLYSTCLPTHSPAWRHNKPAKGYAYLNQTLALVCIFSHDSLQLADQYSSVPLIETLILTKLYI